MEDKCLNSYTRSHLETLSETTSFDTAGGVRVSGFSLEENEQDRANFAEKEGDGAVWSAFTDNFRRVQSVLDQNRLLIQQVNENHQSKVHDNLVKNVALIQEINGNISKVVSLYSELSSNFSNVFHQRNGAVDAKSNSGKRNSDQA